MVLGCFTLKIELSFVVSILRGKRKNNKMLCSKFYPIFNGLSIELNFHSNCIVAIIRWRLASVMKPEYILVFGLTTSLTEPSE